jgi:hypothetical protein
MTLVDKIMSGTNSMGWLQSVHNPYRKFFTLSTKDPKCPKMCFSLRCVTWHLTRHQGAHSMYYISKVYWPFL